MKKALPILIIILLGLGPTTNAQTAFLTADSIDVNNINARLLVHGDMFWDPATMVSKTMFPKGTTKTNNFVASLWMSGYDGAGNLHVSAQTYRQNGNDYWPGPLDGSDTLTYSTSQNWAKIWKINRTDIQHFQLLTTHDTASTLPAILTWPGAGNTYARGATGPITFITGRTYAPFVDLNGNGIYEPLLGEYPDIRGDQALWEVFSDNGATHTETHGKPLGVEVHLMAYAYNRGTEIDNVIYYNYNVFNYSSNTYSNFRLTFFDDMDLGYYNDDYIGFDSTWRLGLQYNGLECDGCTAGSPPEAYGTRVPQSGITMVNVSFPSYADSGSNYLPTGCFDYYNNDFSVIGNPSADSEYNNYMRAKTRSGIHFSNDFTGAGIPSKGYGSGPNTNYVYTGNPSDTSQWSECAANNMPFDRRFLISTGDIALHPGATGQITFAFITTSLDSNNGCPTANFDSIKIYADTAWAIYQNPPPPLPLSVNSNITPDGEISIYPNPANELLYIKISPFTPAGNYEIHDIVGSLMRQGTLSAGSNSIDISAFPAGVYILSTSINGQRTTKKFVKM